MQSFQSYDSRGKNHAMVKEDNTVSSLGIFVFSEMRLRDEPNERLYKR